MADRVMYGRDEGESGTWAIAEGVVLVILGLIALSARYWVATALFTVALPLFLTIAGILLIISAFRAQGAGAAVWDVAFGLIALLAGVALFAQPAITAVSTVAILVAYFFVVGIARIVAAFASRGPGTGWGWTLTVGVIDILLAIYTMTLPVTAMLVFAIVIGIDIFVGGIAMIVVGWQERSHRIEPGATPV